MGFFKNLKERLFTLDIEKIQTSTNDKKNDKKVLAVDDTKNINISKEEKKLSKKIKKQQDIKKYVSGLNKSGASFSQLIKDLKNKHNEINNDFFDELEETLIMSDISFTLVENIIEEIKREVRNEGIKNINLIDEIIVDKIFTIYTQKTVVDTTLNYQDGRKNIYLVVGVNGSGKTTSIAKLAHKLKSEGKKVLIAAADTFRAGAVQQLDVWAKKVGVDIVKPIKDGADPASVVYDGIKKHENGDYDVLIIDTAGRLQNKVNLMNELKKMTTIIQNKFPDAPHESLLVLDATTGQNGVSQAKQFMDVANLTGIILTKMDGTSKGGIVLTIKEQIGLSVKFMGLGEQLGDLQEFDLDAFIYGLTNDLMEEGQNGN